MLRNKEQMFAKIWVIVLFRTHKGHEEVYFGTIDWLYHWGKNLTFLPSLMASVSCRASLLNIKGEMNAHLLEICSNVGGGIVPPRPYLPGPFSRSIDSSMLISTSKCRSWSSFRSSGVHPSDITQLQTHKFTTSHDFSLYLFEEKVQNSKILRW